MFQKARESSYLESTSLLYLIFRWRKPLIIITIISTCAAILFSGPAFIKPKFRSSVIFFPSSTNSLSKALLEESVNYKQDILAFGEEEQAEQMLQILNSDEIRELIILKYDLLNHYRIDKDEEFPITELHRNYKDNITFSRTEFMSVRIDVLDTDAQIAANIANDISAFLDSIKTKIQQSRAKAALQIVRGSYDAKLFQISKKEDSLQKIRSKGILDFSSQSEILNKEYTQASSVYAGESASLTFLEKHLSDKDTAILGTNSRILGSQAKLKSLKQQMDNLAQYGGASVALNDELRMDREELSKIKKQYENLLVDASQNLTPKFIVNKAVKSEKKSYPVRWLVILVAVTLTFLLSVTIILIFERVRELKSNL